MRVGEALLVGVDGGGTHCRARVTTLDGVLVGEAWGGSANIHTDLNGGIARMLASVEGALRQGGLDGTALGRCHAGLGLAGANIARTREAFAACPLPFRAHSLASDAIVACLGAHGGEDGGLAILGTGSAYVARRNGDHTVFGGWGSAVSDQGSGADIGRSALAKALLAHDGVGPASALTAHVLAEFENDPAAISAFAVRAGPSDFGRFAPVVFDHAETGDPVAASILAGALDIVEASLRRLVALGSHRIAMVGGAAERYRERLSPALRQRIVEPKGTALDGALVLARSTL